jgi:hypothetical protein
VIAFFAIWAGAYLAIGIIAGSVHVARAEGREELVKRLTLGVWVTRRHGVIVVPYLAVRWSALARARLAVASGTVAAAVTLLAA